MEPVRRQQYHSFSNNQWCYSDRLHSSNLKTSEELNGSDSPPASCHHILFVLFYTIMNRLFPGSE